MKNISCFNRTASILPRKSSISVSTCTCHNKVVKVSLGNLGIAMTPKQAATLVNELISNGGIHGVRLVAQGR